MKLKWISLALMRAWRKTGRGGNPPENCLLLVRAVRRSGTMDITWVTAKIFILTHGCSGATGFLRVVRRIPDIFEKGTDMRGPQILRHLHKMQNYQTRLQIQRHGSIAIRYLFGQLETANLSRWRTFHFHHSARDESWAQRTQNKR